MAASDYSFQSRWRVEGTREDVFTIIDNLADYGRWWPSVWIDVEKLDAGDEGGIGATYRLLTNGWLPYLIRWQSRTVEKRFPERLAMEATGDFVGRGEWNFTSDGPFVDMVYDWNIRTDKALLRRLSFLFKPLFSFNHHWAMDRGLEGLKLELARRRATTDEERRRIAAPRAAVFWFGRPKELQSHTTIENSPGPTTTSRS